MQNAVLITSVLSQKDLFITNFSFSPFTKCLKTSSFLNIIGCFCYGKTSFLLTVFAYTLIHIRKFKKIGKIRFYFIYIFLTL